MFEGQTNLGFPNKALNTEATTKWRGFWGEELATPLYLICENADSYN